MKKIILLGTLPILAAFTPKIASASPITCGAAVGTHLSDYIALGSAGCQMNNLFFVFNTTVTEVSPGSGTANSYYDAVSNAANPNRGRAQAASSVTVSVVPANNQFIFSANWSTTGTQSAALEIAYTVQALSGTINKLKSVYVDNQPLSGSPTPTITEHAVCTGGTCGPTDFTNVTNPVTIAPTSAVLTITNVVTEHSNQATASGTAGLIHLSEIDNSFAANSGAGAPEPISFLLMGGGLVALAGFRKYRK